MFEALAHTADAGLRVRAPTEAGLFVEAAAGLLAMLVPDPLAVVGRTRRRLDLVATRRDDLLVDWLNALIRLATAEAWLAAGCDVSLDGAGLTATLHGEPLDRGRHGLRAEVKAATYYDLSLARTADGGWQATVIFDL